MFMALLTIVIVCLVILAQRAHIHEAAKPKRKVPERAISK